MKILWYSNSPHTSSGYGKCAKYICCGLKKAKFDISIQSNYGTLGGMRNYVCEPNIEIPEFPQGGGFSEAETFHTYAVEKFDVISMQYDLWALDQIPNLVKQTNAIFCPYTPIDHLIISPRLKAKLDSCFEIVAMCKYGENLLGQNNYNNVRTIYHGVDTNIYKPPLYSKEEARTLLGYEENSFVITMVAMNRTGRKDIPRQLEAVAKFRKNNPTSNIKLYLHTLAGQPDGDRLLDIIQYLKLDDIVRLPNERQYYLGFPEEEIAKIYQASDVLLAASNSEGFGIPIIESMACGTPVIASKTTSMSELLSPTPEFLVNPIDTHWVGTIPSQVHIIDRDDIVSKLQLAFDSDLKSYQEKLSQYAKETFDWKEKIIPQWIDFYKHIEERLELECVKIPKIR